MGTVANLYDSGPISPIARIKDSIAVWTEEKYIPYRIEYIEGIPASSPFVIDMCMITGAFVALAANGQIANQLVAVLQMDANELFHARWEPIDDVEGGLWQLRNMPRYTQKGGQARTTLFTRNYDPWLCMTTFFVLGINKDAAIGVWNPWAVAQPTARFQFWGFRYILSDALSETALKGPITYLPAQGR